MSMKNAKYCILGRIFQLLVFLEYWISCFELSFSFYHNVLMQLYLYKNTCTCFTIFKPAKVSVLVHKLLHLPFLKPLPIGTNFGRSVH